MLGLDKQKKKGCEGLEQEPAVALKVKTAMGT